LNSQDFTLEQDSLVPPNGWKAYYAATRAIVNVNNEFFRILRERSLPAMAQFWLNADYIKCVYANRQSFSGYNAVMGSCQLAFGWDNVAAFQYQVARDVGTRVVSDMAWVTMKAYVDVDRSPDNVTDVYELHNGRRYLVHHHGSVIIVHGVYEP
ncbi:F-box protein skip8, partial [Phtheirospermum japonicum]